MIHNKDSLEPGVSCGQSAWCETEGAYIRHLGPGVGEIRLRPYVDLSASDAEMIIRTIESMQASCVLMDHRAPHSFSFQAQMAFFHQKTTHTLALWVDMREPCVAAASHMAMILRPTCRARLFYTREQASDWLHAECKG
ncbi:hypothetical protein [Longibacter sp.]|jgi:hypothetical protein|uniref:hypothetical protein n=1 Tax=Longibacter sp. TaxID=2045415 RepID=UPI003EC0FB92